MLLLLVTIWGLRPNYPEDELYSLSTNTLQFLSFTPFQKVRLGSRTRNYSTHDLRVGFTTYRAVR